METTTVISETLNTDQEFATDPRVKQMLKTIARLHNLVLGTDNYHSHMVEAREILDRYGK